jgi:hypothetical protein
MKMMLDLHILYLHILFDVIDYDRFLTDHLLVVMANEFEKTKAVKFLDDDHDVLENHLLVMKNDDADDGHFLVFHVDVNADLLYYDHHVFLYQYVDVYDL